MFEEEYLLEFFKKNEYTRKVCSKCGTPFWSIGRDEICNDTPCAEYTFIGSSPVKKQYELNEMRDKFLKFFEARGHKIINRYPVVARWRDDVFLVNASIYDFQPLVTSGAVEPPANPLVISQPCIRLNDIDLVGKTGKHLTTFEMLGHHAFNTKEKEIYWKEETISYCSEFFTQLGIPKEKIFYKEKPWFGGGNAGPALEVIISGLEVATLVFMSLELDSNGKIKVENDLYSPMKTKVVDPGYGLERIVWLSKGSPTVYNAVHSNFIEHIKNLTGSAVPDEQFYNTLLSECAKLSGMMELTAGTKMLELRKKLADRLAKKGFSVELAQLNKILDYTENIYALADHTKCIAFMLGDGIVPSNVRSGYLARLVIRKTLRLIEEMALHEKLTDIVAKQIEYMKDFPELKENSDTIMKILEVEMKKYHEVVERSPKIVAKALETYKEITPTTFVPMLVNLYDTYGIYPTLALGTIAAKGIDIKRNMGVEISEMIPSPLSKIEIPETFHSLLAEKHSKPEVVGKVEIPAEIAKFKTETIFYDVQEKREFDAVVIHAKGSELVLDRTGFFPESGGQVSDTGVMIAKDKTVTVVNVQKIGNAVVHITDGALDVGEKVHCKINWDRRTALTRHHTATHIILGAARAVLGKHIWQQGAQKNPDFARVDISHFRRISDEELSEIEKMANVVVMENITVEKNFVDRNDAERKYGFKLYQGGVPAGNKIRVVKIGDFDIQACGGMHCNSTSEVGLIKIMRHERIQDGIERIEFAAGTQALKEIQLTDKLLREAAFKLKVTQDEIPKAIDKVFEILKTLKKELEVLREYRARAEVKRLSVKTESFRDVKIVSDILPLARDELVVLAGELIKRSSVIAVLGTSEDGVHIIIARSKNLEFIDCSEIAKECAEIIGGSGGGKKDFAQGGGTKKEALTRAIEQAKKHIKAKMRR